MMGRILAVDPGEKRIGLAISDETATLSRPLKIIEHVNRENDASRIVQTAIENGADRIIIGLPLDREGKIGPKARRSERLADHIRLITELDIILWDETDSSKKAMIIKNQVRGKKKKAIKEIDDIAAAIILQSYLDNVQVS